MIQVIATQITQLIMPEMLPDTFFTFTVIPALHQELTGLLINLMSLSIRRT
jgi:hypothetical protein